MRPSDIEKLKASIDKEVQRVTYYKRVHEVHLEKYKVAKERLKDLKIKLKEKLKNE